MSEITAEHARLLHQYALDNDDLNHLLDPLAEVLSHLELEELHNTEAWQLGHTALKAVAKHRTDQGITLVAFTVDEIIAAGNGIIASRPARANQDKVWFHLDDIPKDAVVIDNDGDRNKLDGGAWKYYYPDEDRWVIMCGDLDTISKDSGPFVLAYDQK